MDPNLSIVIPLTKETKHLPLTLIDFDNHLSRLGRPYEVFIVPAKTDQLVKETVRRFSPFIKNLTLIEGAGSQLLALKEIVKTARGRFLLLVDPSRSVSLSEAAKLVEQIENGSDVATVWRKNKKTGGLKAALLKTASLIARLISPGLNDPLTPFQCFSLKSAGAIFTRLKTPPEGSFAESLAVARRLRLRIKEVETEIEAPIFSLVEFFGIIKKVATIRFWLWLGAY